MYDSSTVGLRTHQPLDVADLINSLPDSVGINPFPLRSTSLYFTKVSIAARAWSEFFGRSLHGICIIHIAGVTGSV
jgi:hypothetical protein